METAHSIRKRVTGSRVKKRPSITQLISLAASAINNGSNSGNNSETVTPHATTGTSNSNTEKFHGFDEVNDGSGTTVGAIGIGTGIGTIVPSTSAIFHSEPNSESNDQSGSSTNTNVDANKNNNNNNNNKLTSVTQTATRFRDVFSSMIRSTSSRSIDGNGDNSNSNSNSSSNSSSNSNVIENNQNICVVGTDDVVNVHMNVNDNETKSSIATNTVNVAESVRNNISRWWQSSTAIIDKMGRPEHSNDTDTDNDTGNSTANGTDPTKTPEEVSNVDNGNGNGNMPL